MEQFETSVTLHLKAIEKRDFTAFSQCLHPLYPCMIITGDGEIMQGYDAILQFHQSWFADDSWRMESRIIDSFWADTMGYALIENTYYETDTAGNPRSQKLLMSLVFQNIDGQWFLRRDQNTPIR